MLFCGTPVRSPANWASGLRTESAVQVAPLSEPPNADGSASRGDVDVRSPAALFGEAPRFNSSSKPFLTNATIRSPFA